MSVRFTGLKSQSGPVLHPQLMLKKCGNFIKKKKSMVVALNQCYNVMLVPHHACALKKTTKKTTITTDLNN